MKRYGSCFLCSSVIFCILLDEYTYITYNYSIIKQRQGKKDKRSNENGKFMGRKI